jgi:hypothetical protein
MEKGGNDNRPTFWKEATFRPPAACLSALRTLLIHGIEREKENHLPTGKACEKFHELWHMSNCTSRARSKSAKKRFARFVLR